jgi:ABC-type phosphate/phosphonate transport system substrate-binding protein
VRIQNLPASQSLNADRFAQNVFGVRAFVRLAILCAIGSPPDRSHAAEPAADHIRIAFSRALFTEINENDAKASVKAWGLTVAKDRGIPAEPESSILKGIPALQQALRDKAVDAVGITSLEYATLSQDVAFAHIFVTYSAGRTTEQYVLLAHQASTINNLADLRGRSLAFQTNPRSCLAQPWLDTLLVQQGLKPAAEFTGKITSVAKLPQVVLPVFFRQCDACVVTRTGFETMAELNPQVAKQLKVIATSPTLVPTIFCFRLDYSPSFKETLLTGLRDLHRTPAGLQVLTVFQSEKIEEQPAACLDSVLELMATYRKMCGPAVAANSPATPLPAGKEDSAR